MRILHLPLTVPGSEQIGQERGFREVFGNENYRQFDFLNLEKELGRNGVNDSLKSIVAELQPDIIWAQLQETDTILPETWEFIHKTYPHIHMTCFSGDAREYVPSGMQQWLKYFDIFYNDTDQKEMYQPYCNRYEFMPIAVDPEEGTDYSHPTGSVPDIIFIGNDYGNTFSNGPFRKELMIALTKEFGDRFGVYGTGWNQNEVNILGTCPVKHQGAYYHKATIVISVDHIKGITHHSERLVWSLMSGTPTLVQIQPKIKELFQDHKHCYYFDTPTECVNMVRWILENQEEAELVGQTGKELALERYIWSERAGQILRDFISRKTVIN